MHTRRANPLMPLTVQELLDRARQRLVRVQPEQAARELAEGALLGDIRPSEQRAQGEIPGATVIERNVLEWRLHPPSPGRIPGGTHPTTPRDRDSRQGLSLTLCA